MSGAISQNELRESNVSDMDLVFEGKDPKGGWCWCLCGDRGMFGYKTCCGHDTKKIEPKWVMKLFYLSGELAWALSLQPSYENPMADLDPEPVAEWDNYYFMTEEEVFTDEVVRPMAWLAFGGMMLHVVLQVANNFCLGEVPLVDSLALWIDLLFDDAVQLTALFLHFTYGAGEEKGDKTIAYLNGIFATFFACHNLVNLCAKRKRCFGKGYSRKNYDKTKDGAAKESWCPDCVLPCLPRLCGWFCNCFSTVPKVAKSACCECFFEELEDGKLEFNCPCPDFGFLEYDSELEDERVKQIDGYAKSSWARILCYLFFNSWIMTLLAINATGATVWYLHHPKDDIDNPYKDTNATDLAMVSMIMGWITLGFAYILEGIRAKWIAEARVDENDKKWERLSTWMNLVLLLNFGGSLGPWAGVSIIVFQTDHTDKYFSIMSITQIFLTMIVTFWEVTHRKLSCMKNYLKDSHEDLRQQANNAIIIDNGGRQADLPRNNSPRDSHRPSGGNQSVHEGTPEPFVEESSHHIDVNEDSWEDQGSWQSDISMPLCDDDVLEPKTKGMKGKKKFKFKPKTPKRGKRAMFGTKAREQQRRKARDKRMLAMQNESI